MRTAKGTKVRMTVQGKPCGEPSASHATQGAFPQFGVVGGDLRDRCREQSFAHDALSAELERRLGGRRA